MPWRKTLVVTEEDQKLKLCHLRGHPQPLAG